MRRTDMSPEQRKRHVVDCARELFVRNGYAGTSTLSIAKAADISEMTLFRYFPHKRDIFLYVIRPVLEVFTPETQRGTANVLSRSGLHGGENLNTVEQVVWEFLQRKMRFIQNNRALLLLVLIESHLQPDLAGDFNPIVQVQTQLRVLLVTHGLNEEDASLAIRLMTGLLMSTLFAPPDGELDRKVAEQIFEMLKQIFRRGSAQE